MLLRFAWSIFSVSFLFCFFKVGLLSQPAPPGVNRVEPWSPWEKQQRQSDACCGAKEFRRASSGSVSMLSSAEVVVAQGGVTTWRRIAKEPCLCARPVRLGVLHSKGMATFKTLQARPPTQTTREVGSVGKLASPRGVRPPPHATSPGDPSVPR